MCVKHFKADDQQNDPVTRWATS